MKSLVKKQLSFFILLLTLASSSIFAFEAKDNHTINQIIENVANIWNEHDNHGFADHYAQDAEFVNIYGMASKGREAIETRHIKILETFFKGTQCKVLNITQQEVTPEVVIAHVYWQLNNGNKGSLKEPMKGIYIHVFVKKHDKWQIIATQNTLISNQPNELDNPAALIDSQASPQSRN